MQGFVRVVFRIDASDLFAHISHPRREVLEDIILRHIDHSMRIVVKDHSICVELLDRLETFWIAVAELLIISVFGNSGELECFNLFTASIILFEDSVCDIKVESDEIALVKLLWLPVIRNIHERYHRYRVLRVDLMVQFILRIVGLLLVAAALQPETKLYCINYKLILLCLQRVSTTLDNTVPMIEFLKPSIE